MTAGTVLGGRYELRVRLGSGGAGTVWSAFDATLRREVAVKLIAVDAVPFADTPAMIERFRREAQAVAALNHPNVVTAYDFGLQDEVAFLVMERIVGASLAEHLHRIQASGAAGFDEPTVVRIGRQVCAGLAVAHRARLVHRDLKPSNLMLVESTGQVKIVDFGIARAAEQSRLTRTGSYLGTLPYVAPEQMDADPVDGRADLYSLGCVLHELATGRSPYDANTPMQWMSAHQYASPAPLRTHVPAASAELESLLLRLLAKKPAYRPADADAVGDLLAGMASAVRVIGGPQVDTGAHLLARLSAGPAAAARNVARPVPPAAGVTGPETMPRSRVGAPTESGAFAPPFDLRGGVDPVSGGGMPGGVPPDRGTLTGASIQPATSYAGQIPDDAVLAAESGGLATTPSAVRGIAVTSAPPAAPVSPSGAPVSPPGAAAPGGPVSPPISGPPRAAAQYAPPQPAPGPSTYQSPPSGRIVPAPPRPRGSGPRPPAGRGGQRPPVSGQHPVGAPSRRHTGLWVTLLVVLLLGGAAAGAVAFWHSAKHRHPTAAQPPPPFVPQVGDCFVSGWASPSDADETSVWAAGDRAVPVSCGGSHSFEVVAVDDLAHPAAAPLPPLPDSAVVRSIYRACVADANAYLGGDWRTAYAWLGVALPNATAWQRGAHWRACVLLSTGSWEGTLTSTFSSLRDGLRGSRPAAVTCFSGAAGIPTACTAPHTDEVVGVYRAAAGVWPGVKAVGALAHDECGTIVAHFLGLAGVADWHNHTLGWSWWPPDQEQWELGNRSVVCAAQAYTSSGTMTGSVKGIGNADPQH